MPTPDINKILADNPVSATRGAPLGAINFHASNSPLYLQRLRLVDGDYGADGTYWGATVFNDVWCAFNGEDDDYAPARGSRIYVRAKNRKEAVEEVKRIARTRGWTVQLQVSQ